MKDLEAIKGILPHRYPFLMIDRVLEIEAGKYCKALKNITTNEEVFQGHFPRQAVFPGVLMVEAMAQTAGMVIHSSSEAEEEEGEGEEAEKEKRRAPEQKKLEESASHHFQYFILCNNPPINENGLFYFSILIFAIEKSLQ